MSRSACVIVGGGPAGLSTALFLADAAPELRGRLVVLEKERYPREKYCAGAVGARGDGYLASIGVRVDVPSVPVNGLALRTMGQTRVVRAAGAGRVVRRIEFDHALAQAAMRRGIEVRQGVRVLDVTAHAHGAVVRTSAGDLGTDVVVGADGVGSVVRRRLGVAPTPYLAQALEVDTEPLPTDLPRDVLAFDVSRRDVRGYVWDFPTVVDGRPLVCRGVYALRDSSAPPGPDIEQVLSEELARRGLSLSACRKKRYAERGFHAGGRVSAPRVLLVGEAAGIDAVSGEGIAQALAYGLAAGRYLAGKLRRGDLGFADWAAVMRRRSIGRDLLVREAAVPLAYGRHRPRVEEFLLSTPEFLRMGLLHFGGQSWGGAEVARAAVSALGAAARATAGRLGPSIGVPGGVRSRA